MSNNWAKEQDYINQISSFSQIKSTSVTGIIKEARQKQKQLEDVFNKKARDLDKDLATARTRVLAAAKNETQAAVGELLTTTATVLARRKLEKEERNARQNLERQKERELSKIAEKLKEKYLPIRQNALKAATLALSEDAEEFYLKQYEFAACMMKDADEIIRGGNYCKDPGNRSFKNNSKNISGETYYNTFSRKSNSSNESIKQKAPYFLELALQKKPNNPKWLYEKSQLKNIELIEKLAILKKVIALDNKNVAYGTAYDSTLKEYKKFLEQERIFEEQKAKYGSDIVKKTIIQASNSNYNWAERENVKLVYVPKRNETFFINKQGKTILNTSKYDTVTDFFEGLALVSKDERYGFINIKGETIIPLKYKNARTFDEGMAFVVDVETYLAGFINKNGETVIPFEYIDVSSFSEGLAFATKLKDGKKRTQDYVPESDKNSFYIDRKGNVKISGKFDKGVSFINKSAVVKKSKTSTFMGGGNDKYKYIDTNGEYLFNEGFDIARPFNNKGYAIVANEKFASGLRWFIIDSKGEKTSKITFGNEPKFINNVAIANIGGSSDYTSKYVIIDDTGKVLTNKEYKRIESFKDGLALAKDEYDQSIYLNLLGEEIDNDDEILFKRKENEVLEIEELKDLKSIDELENSLKEIYIQVWKTDDGFLVQHNNQNSNNRGFFNWKGENIIPVKYPWLTPFSDGLAVFSEVKGKYGYMNLQGDSVIDPIYDFAEMHSEGIAIVTLKKQMGFIDTNGKIVIPIEYQAVFAFTEGLARICDNGKCGYINENAEIVIPLKYIMVEPFKNGKAKVSLKKPKKNDYFYINKFGEKVE